MTNPLDLPTLDTADPIEKRVQALGLTEQDKAIFNLNLNEHLNRLARHIAPLELEARKTVAISTAQETINNSRQQLLNGSKTFDELQADTFKAYSGDSMYSFEGEENKTLIKNELNLNTKMMLQKAFDEKNKPVIDAFLNKNKYDKEILIGSNGINELRTLRHEAKSTLSNIEINTEYQKTLPIIKDLINNPQQREVLNSNIRKNKNLSADAQEQLINKIDAEIVSQKNIMVEEAQQKEVKVKAKINSFLDKGDKQGALDYLNSEEVRSAIPRNLGQDLESMKENVKNGMNPFKQDNDSMVVYYQNKILKITPYTPEGEVTKLKDAINLSIGNGISIKTRDELVNELGKKSNIQEFDWEKNRVLSDVNSFVEKIILPLGKNEQNPEIIRQRELTVLKKTKEIRAEINRNITEKNMPPVQAFEEATKSLQEEHIKGWLESKFPYAFLPRSGPSIKKFMEPPKEGDTQTLKSGNTVIFKNGKWGLK